MKEISWGFTRKTEKSYLRRLIETILSVIDFQDMISMYLINSKSIRRLGRNRAIAAIARILLETIYSMLKKGEDFVDQIDTLAERKMKSIRSRAVKPSQIITVEDRID